MKKPAWILPAIVVLIAACGGGSNSVAATVDGEDITLGEVEALIDPGEVSTIGKDEFAEFLGFAIRQQIFTTAAESDFGIVIDESDIAAEADSIMEGANTEGLSREEFLSTNGVTETMLLEVAHQSLLQSEVRTELESVVPEPSKDESGGADTEAATSYCASHILVATEQEATAVLDRLAAGEEFADLATELSTDTNSGALGGDLGCAPAETYVTEFADALTLAEVGVPYGPVETDFGFHVILLREDPDAAINDWFLGILEAAEVTVVESYGTWDSTVPGVVPPTE